MFFQWNDFIIILISWQPTAATFTSALYRTQHRQLREKQVTYLPSFGDFYSNCFCLQAIIEIFMMASGAVWIFYMDFWMGGISLRNL